jgi:adenosylmethionine-8-amino-7-oxononanoate aminotransferase
MNDLASAKGAAAHGGSIQLFYARSAARNRPTVDRAEGIYVWDTAGRRYIDACSGPVVSNIGHGNPRVLEAMVAQAK